MHLHAALPLVTVRNTGYHNSAVLAPHATTMHACQAQTTGVISTRRTCRSHACQPASRAIASAWYPSDIVARQHFAGRVGLIQPASSERKPSVS